jgi:hypothetical protein
MEYAEGSTDKRDTTSAIKEMKSALDRLKRNPMFHNSICSLLCLVYVVHLLETHHRGQEAGCGARNPQILPQRWDAGDLPRACRGPSHAQHKGVAFGAQLLSLS